MKDAQSLRLLFSAVLPEGNCLNDTDSLIVYGSDWSQSSASLPSLVVFPQSTQQVVQVVKVAAEHHIPLVPSCGRTGLSGGANACAGEVVVSLEKMKEVLSLNLTSGVMRCQAGVVTQTIQEISKSNGWYYPVDFASAGSSQIGGNVATNAGGMKVIRYGMTRSWVVGLTAVTGSGEILQLNKDLIKNNTGYDLRHLLIGSEGTLGIITEVSLALTQPPPPLTVALIALPTLSRVADLLELLSAKVALYSFEFFSVNTQQYMSENGPALPFSEKIIEDSFFYVLLEVPKIEFDVLQGVVSHAIQVEVVNEVVVAQSEAAAKNLWQYREGISESIAYLKPYKNDVSVTADRVDEFVAAVDDYLSQGYQGVEVLWHGHFGDGNVHINILRQGASEADFIAAMPSLNEGLYQIVAKYEGSISAEHGVGSLKKPYLHYTRSEQEVALMKQIKQAFDPQGIMNPGKLL